MSALLEKIAVRILQYSDSDGKSRWTAQEKGVPAGAKPTGVSFYVRKGRKKKTSKATTKTRVLK